MKKDLYLLPFLASILLIALVVATYTSTSVPPTINEDSSKLFNVTISNTDVTGGAGNNITEINITLPHANITFGLISTNGSNNGVAVNVSVVNVSTATSAYISWKNSSINLANSSLLINITASQPGTYNITVSVKNSTFVEYTNVSIIVNDTTAPTEVSLDNATDRSGQNLSRAFIFANVTAVDNGVLRVNVTLYNKTGIYNVSVGSTSPYVVNFTGLPDGNYTLNVSASDTFWNTPLSNTTTYNYTVDTVVPNVTIITPANRHTNLTVTYIIYNATASDLTSGVTNITIRLFNSTNDQINSTSTLTTLLQGNFSLLADGKYTVNITAYDASGNTNSSYVNVTVDTVVPNVTIITPANRYTNLSVSYIIYNATASDITSPITNITIRLFNSTNNQINSTSTTTSLLQGNFSLLADGKYTVNITSYDSSGNTNSSYVNVTVDTVLPNVTIITPANRHTNLTVTYIIYNATASDITSPITNITIRLFNSTNNQINSTSTTTSLLQGNFSILSNGTYTVNVTSYDSSGNTNSSYVNVTIDNAVPIITLDSPADAASSTTTGSTAGVLFKFNVSDISYLPNCTLYVDSVPTVSTNTSTSITNEITEALSIATHSWSVNCTDTLGNVGNSSTRSYIVTAATASSSSSSGGGGSSSSSSPTSSQLQAGYQKEFYKNTKVSFTLNSAIHSVTAKDLTKDYVLVEVASTPQQAAIKAGESSKFDLNADGYYDLKVLVNSISYSLTRLPKASLTVYSINEKISAPPVAQEQPPQQEQITDEPAQPLGEKTSSSVLKITLGIIVLLIIAVVIVFLIKRRK